VITLEGGAAGGGGDGGASTTSSSTATTGTSAGGNGGHGGTLGMGGDGTSSSSSGAPPLPPLPACFPGTTDDFSDPALSAAAWLAHNVSFEDGVAALGNADQGLAFLGAEAALPESCFVSFRVGPIGRQGAAYALLKTGVNGESFDDLDVVVSETNVRLYTRPRSEFVSAQRTGDLILLVLSGLQATVYQAGAAASDWQEVGTITMPHALLEAELQFIRYPDLPAFSLDDVNLLPDALLINFPPP
jgi:hypothetical protein